MTLLLITTWVTQWSESSVRMKEYLLYMSRTAHSQSHTR